MNLTLNGQSALPFTIMSNGIPISTCVHRGYRTVLSPSLQVHSKTTFRPHTRLPNDRIEKTCQHSAMKHPKQNKRAPQTHRAALAVPSYHRNLVKHGLIEKTLPIPDAYEVFLKGGADPEVQKLRRNVAHGNRIKHVP